MENVVVRIWRGNNVESLHEGFITIVDTEGRIKAGYGNSRYETFLRSSAKPFQIYPLLLKNGHEKYGFTPKEIALMCSSHTGQPEHVEAARSILSKIGLDESYLKCGTHAPLFAEAAENTLLQGKRYEQIQNNCSGKHSGFLAQTVLFGTDPETYLEMSNPVQQHILKAISIFSDMPVEELHAGVDGCSAPIYLMPLDKMALMFARLAQGSDHLLKIVRDSIVENPFYIGGDSRFDTAFMKATGGRFVSKTGAEGVQCVGIIDGGPRPECTGWGLALKILDGSLRSKGPAAVEALDQLGVLTDDDRKALADLKEPKIINHAGITAGKLEPWFKLNTV